MLYDSYHYLSYTLLTEQPIRHVMTHFKIKRSLLPKSKTRHKYMYQDGQLDYLGQFIVQLGYQIPPKTRFPSNLNKIIFPFTQQSRGAIIDSITTIRILALDHTSPQDHERQLQEILPNWTITFIS